jgi:sec-independent protein translocase protein TatA
MGGIGVPELLIVLLIVLVLFGSTRLPKLAKSLGQASREFKKGIDDDKEEAAKAEEQVTMSKSELDALLAEREARAREAQAPPGPPTDTPPSS